MDAPRFTRTHKDANKRSQQTNRAKDRAVLMLPCLANGSFSWNRTWPPIIHTTIEAYFNWLGTDQNRHPLQLMLSLNQLIFNGSKTVTGIWMHSNRYPLMCKKVQRSFFRNDLSLKRVYGSLCFSCRTCLLLPLTVCFYCFHLTLVSMAMCVAVYVNSRYLSRSLTWWI